MEGRAEFGLHTSFNFCKNNKTKNTTKPHCASVQPSRAMANKCEPCLLAPLCLGRMWGTHLALLWGPCVWFPDNLEASLEMTSASHGGSFPNPGMCDQGTHGGWGCFYQVPPTPASVLCFMVLPYQLKNQHEHHQSLIATPAGKQQLRVSLSCIWSIAHCTDRQPEAQGRGLAKDHTA